MDTDDNFDLDSYLIELGNDESISEWIDIQDLNKMSIEQHQINTGVTKTVLSSSGAIRLIGAGVAGHSLSMNAAGEVLSRFQNLVTAIGASLQGVQNERGKIPAAISDSTKLMLDASPAPGSVILKFSPGYQPTQEENQLKLELEEEEDSLVEQSINGLIDALSLPGESQEDFLNNADSIDTSGPRVVSATKGLMEALSHNDLDLDLKWRAPRTRMRKLLFKASQAKAFFDALDKVETDSGFINVSAIVERISRVPNPHVILKVLSIDQYDSQNENTEEDLRPFVRESVPEVLHVSLEDGDSHFQQFRIDDQVKARLLVDATRFPGKSWKLAFVLNEWK